ncbi:MAG: hypothetical protein U0P30_07355 [Vicinamibacterales bacterium]
MRLTLPMLTLAATLLACLAPRPAQAQVSLAAIAADLPTGHRTELTVDGRPLTGDLVRASADGIVLWRYDTGATDEIAAQRVSTVTYDDSLLNGSLMGALMGAVPGFIVGLPVQEYCRNEVASSRACASVPFKVAAVTGLVGLGVGTAIDGAIADDRAPRARADDGAQSDRVTRPDRRGPMALVSITF